MNIKFRLTIAIIAGIALLTGCSGDKGNTSGTELQQSTTAVTDKVKDEGISIGDLHLSDSSDKVAGILGKDYEETVQEEGYFGESVLVRKYNKGVEAVIGKDSQKLLQITVYSDDLETNEGINVGDTSEKIYKKYRSKYDEYQSVNSDGKLEGWFDVGEGMLVIFDFNKSDDNKLNKDVKPESKVEAITLAYSKFFD